MRSLASFQKWTVLQEVTTPGNGPASAPAVTIGAGSEEGASTGAASSAAPVGAVRLDHTGVSVEAEGFATGVEAEGFVGVDSTAALVELIVWLMVLGRGSISGDLLAFAADSFAAAASVSSAGRKIREGGIPTKVMWGRPWGVAGSLVCLKGG